MKMHHIFIGFFISIGLAVVFGVGLFVRAYEPSTAPKLINAGTPRILTVGWDKGADAYALVSAVKGKAEIVPADNKTGYEFNLSNGILVISRDRQTVWQSPADWWVASYILADVNHDGKVELNLSVWKPGDFGPSKPVWIEKNDMSVKNHLFVYELSADGVHSLWQSSNLDQPTCEFVFADFDGDSKQELGVIEGEYTTTRACRGKFMAIWKWDEWGFYNQWRSNAGHFSDLHAVLAGGETYLQSNLIID